MPPTRLTDAQRAGARAVLTEHGPALWRIALVVSGSRQDAEDLLAAAVLRALPHLHRVDSGGPAAVPAYLRRVMLNLRASEWRRRRATVLLSAEAANERPETTGDLADRVALRTDIAACLDRLGPRQRAVVILRYLEDRSVADTARLLDCSSETVRSQAHRALARLRIEVPGLFVDDVDGQGIAAEHHADDERTPS
jgi:RNA polymerase sigma factor (sigma-70 family)